MEPLYSGKESKVVLTVEVIPHSEQRYEMLGDWHVGDDGADRVLVSDTGNPTHNMLIALHEAIEMFLCKLHGVQERDVCDFDVAFDLIHGDTDDEPGEDPLAPYFKEHAVADVVERLLALHAGIKWKEYGEAVNDLFKPA